MMDKEETSARICLYSISLSLSEEFEQFNQQRATSIKWKSRCYTVSQGYATLQIPMAQLGWNLPFVCCLNKRPSGTSCKNDRCIQPSKHQWKSGKSPLSRHPDRAEEQRSTSERKPSPSSGHFPVALQHAIWGNNVNRPGDPEKRPSLWATSQQREFRLFQLCNSEFSDPQVTYISTRGSIVDTDRMMELDLFPAPPPPVVAFRRSEMPSGQILWHLVACPSNRAFRSRKELAVGCGPQRAWGSRHLGHARTNKHLNMKMVEPCKARKNAQKQLTQIGCTTPSVRFCCIFVCQTESKGFAPYFSDAFTFLDFFSTDLASRRTPGP